MHETLVYIEISKNTNIKYEFDKELNALICDRVLFTPFAFPFNYGFVPQTLSGDGDPLDAIVIMDKPLVPGCYIKCKIIGCLETEDEKGDDKKMILTPIKKVSPIDAQLDSIDDIPELLLEQIIYFYQHYKDLEKKSVKVGKMLNKEEAYAVYLDAQQKYLLN
jgi:inorganic pyrophosphatase